MPQLRNYLITAAIMAVVGWGGLAALVALTLPTVWPRWLFFFLWVLALSGTALPIVYWLNARDQRVRAPEPHVVIRQALWPGIFGATLAWFQLGRVASLWMVISLAGGLAAIEYLIRVREGARRRTAVAESKPPGRVP